MSLSLPDVTICTIDCITPFWGGEAINISSHEINFGDAILFSNHKFKGKFRNVLIPKIHSRSDYSKFVIQELGSHINTQFVLIVQWDGYVICPKAWDSEFLNFDYIGATWPWVKSEFRMGNGGFSLRSKKLMQSVSEDSYRFNYSLNEDHIICTILRPSLEAKGFKFASNLVANKFSYEFEDPQCNTFGFHGLFNMWRYLDDATMVNLLLGLSPSTFIGMEYLQLMIVYLNQKKFSIFKKMYNLMLNHLNGTNPEDHLQKFIKDAASINWIINSALACP